MKNQNRKSARNSTAAAVESKSTTASPKARRKAYTLRLDAETALPFERFVARFYADELDFFKPETRSRYERDAKGMAHLRRWLGLHLLTMASEAMLERTTSLNDGCAWWKLLLTDMDPEERDAREAMISAGNPYRGGSLAPISDEQETNAIQKIKESKAPAKRKAEQQPAASLPSSSATDRWKVALDVMEGHPELMAAVEKEMNEFFERFPETPRNRFNEAFIFSLSLEQLGR